VQKIATTRDDGCDRTGRVVGRSSRTDEDNDWRIATCRAQSRVDVVGFNDTHARIDRNAIAAQEDQGPHDRLIGRRDEKV
jgi:hypothetical protein